MAVAQTILRHWLPACALGVVIGYFVGAAGCADGSAGPARTEPPPDGVWLLTIEIPELLDADALTVKYADPVASALRQAGMGDVSGSGDRINDKGTRTGCFLDVDVTTLDPALKVIIATLRNQGAPSRSRIDLLHPRGNSIPVGP